MNIPNLLSVIRILLIPVFTYEFIVCDDYITAGIILIISGITDSLDGIIARKFNMITDIGKVLDPIADKLTQIMAVFCLAVKGNFLMWLLFGFLFIKDLALVIGGITLYKKKDYVVSANWYGKIATIVFYVAVTFIMIFGSNISSFWEDVIILLIILASFFALGGYISYFFKIRSKKF